MFKLSITKLCVKTYEKACQFLAKKIAASWNIENVIFHYSKT